MYTCIHKPSIRHQVRRIFNGHSRPSGASRCCSTAISCSYRSPGDAPSYKEISSTAQGAQALDKTMHVSFFTTVIVFEQEVTVRRAHRSAQPSADGPHDERQCVGTAPAAAAIHGTSMDPVQPATPQTGAIPDYPCRSHCHPWA